LAGCLFLGALKDVSMAHRKFSPLLKEGGKTHHPNNTQTSGHQGFSAGHLPA